MITLFNIHDDLKTRTLAEQAEILWISGPRAFNAAAVAMILGVAPERVPELIIQARAERKPSHNG